MFWFLLIPCFGMIALGVLLIFIAGEPESQLGFLWSWGVGCFLVGLAAIVLDVLVFAFYVGLCVIAVTYALGSWQAIKALKRNTQEYTRRDLWRAAAFSWYAAVLEES